jgi:energy-converting hydrogenase A subunit M
VTGYLYEKDLISQKYQILMSPRHDHLVRELAAELQIPVQEIRKYLIEHLDMILLENLPARAEAAAADCPSNNDLATGLGRTKYAVYIPIVTVAAMDAIFYDANERVLAGMPVADAVAYGKAKIREVLRQ